jgi:fumarylacetoacetate (FAA) hydrolase family protein
MEFTLDAEIVLPEDGTNGTLVGRCWVPDAHAVGGPSVVVVTDTGVYDISRAFPTTTQLMDAAEPALAAVTTAETVRLGGLDEILANSVPDDRDPSLPWFVAPIDLQAIKAAGVTFLDSLMERVIEELAKGDRDRAEEIRSSIAKEIGASLTGIRPGSEEAMRLKDSLIRRELWSPYLEVGIGPDAEIFTKAQPMSAVGVGAEIGTPSPRRCSWSTAAARSSAPPSATTSICATSRAGARCSSPAPRTTTRAARSARSSACSTRPSISAGSRRPTSAWRSRARTSSRWSAPRRCG